VEWILLAQVGSNGWVLVNPVINLEYVRPGISLTGSAGISLSRRNLLRSVGQSPRQVVRRTVRCGSA
jgi:hypothetical protein